MKRLTVLFVALVAMVYAVAAVAATPTSTDMLKFFTGGAGSISWASDGGSSTAGDNQALKLSGTTQGTDYSGAYAIGATSAAVKLSQLNASFDLKGYKGAGSPRISVPVDTNGDGTTDMWAYLSAYYCTGSPASNGFTHYDFQSPGCTIYTSSSDVLNGLSDRLNATGSISYAYGGFTFSVNDGGPRGNWTVATDYQPFLVLDEAPAVAYVDNLTIGSYNWQRPGKPGFVKNLALSPPVDSGSMSWSDGVNSFDVTDIASVSIGGGVVAFSGHMSSGEGSWAASDGQVIQEYLDTNTGNLYGKIGGTNEAPASTSGLDGPFAYTGTVTVS